MAEAEKTKCPNQGVTDDGLISVANIARIGAIAVAVINTLNALKIANLQKDIADKYQAMADEALEYAKTWYRPCESKAVNDACGDSVYERKFDDISIGRMITTVKSKTKRKLEKELTCVPKYCTGKIQNIIKNNLLEQATAEALVAGLGYRYEEDREQARNDVRWNRRAAILNVGRGIPGDVVTYAGLASGLFGGLSDQYSKAAGSAIQYLSYTAERNPTVFPQRNQIEYPTWNVPYTETVAPVVFKEEKVNRIDPPKEKYNN